MPYQVVEDFKLGMDRRKSRLSGIPGSLWTLQNALIGRGGEIERAKKFVSTYALPAGQTFGLAAIGTALYVFGSNVAPAMPAGTVYQRLQHPDGVTAMTAVLSRDLSQGKLYVIAQYADTSIHHFYDGKAVTDWDAGRVKAYMLTNSGIAAHMAALINGNGINFTAVATANVIRVTGNDTSGNFLVAPVAANGGLVNDQTFTAGATNVQEYVAVTAEILSSFSFQVTGGSLNAGVNKISSITVNGVTITSGAVDWTISNAATAAALVANINAFGSSPDYTASLAGQTVKIMAAAGTGIGPNTFAVVVTPAGTVTVSPASGALANGVTGVAGQPKIVDLTVGGTFDPGDHFSVAFNASQSNAENFGYNATPDPVGTIAFAYKSKVYSPGGSLMNFSGVLRPDVFNRDNAIVPGAGFINVSSQDGGSAGITGMEIYQGSMAIFGELGVQVWTMSDNPALNSLTQNLRNTGTRSPRSVKSYGSLDVFYLAQSGIRSLRALVATSVAFASDIGSPMDSFIQAHIRTLTDQQVASACCEIEPLDERYWLAVNDRLYVHSYFPSAQISAWSYVTPGFVVSDLARTRDKLYARSGDTIYLYGGADGQQYPGDGEQIVLVDTPFFDKQAVATKVKTDGFDFGATNTWDIWVLPDPANDQILVGAGTTTGTSYNMQNFPVHEKVTHVAFRLQCSKAGNASLTSLAFNYVQPKTPPQS